MKTIYFDMDGTIADFYGVENWLEYLQKENAYPYKVAHPLVDTQLFSKVIQELQLKGYRIGIISWCSKHGTKEYNRQVRQTKKEWLKEHFDINFDTIHIVKYGTNKSKFRKDDDILFDDEILNRELWGKNSYNVHNIFGVLQSL